MLRHSASICKPHWHARGFTALSQLVQATEDALACLQSHGAEIHLSQNGRQIRPHDLKLEPVTLIFATRDANRYKEPRAASPDEVHGTGRYVEEIEGANGSHQGSKQSAGDIDVLSPAAALEQFINAGVFNKGFGTSEGSWGDPLRSASPTAEQKAMALVLAKHEPETYSEEGLMPEHIDLIVRVLPADVQAAYRETESTYKLLRSRVDEK